MRLGLNRRSAGVVLARDLALGRGCGERDGPGNLSEVEVFTYTTPVRPAKADIPACRGTLNTYSRNEPCTQI